MEFLPKEISRYTENHTRPESEFLAGINRDTHAEVLVPRMLSGHLQGQVLRMLSLFIRPKYILEVGTYTGYSALCLADGLQEGGALHTIDINEELEDRVRGYFNKSDHKDRIHFHIGDARQIITTLNHPWDLVFLDADKEGYLTYYKMVLPLMPSGGVIIADNVLWSGKVLDEKALSKDKDTRALHEFNTFVHRDERVENVLFPIRDGLMVIRKK
ncbi:MAG: O-methyltransferase [Cryomorphaceae bacterium]|nr:O-methyltransferase [Cryomorphaceae bacterium]